MFSVRLLLRCWKWMKIFPHSPTCTSGSVILNHPHWQLWRQECHVFLVLCHRFKLDSDGGNRGKLFFSFLRQSVDWNVSQILPQRLLSPHEYRFRLFMQRSRLEQIEKLICLKLILLSSLYDFIKVLGQWHETESLTSFLLVWTRFVCSCLGCLNEVYRKRFFVGLCLYADIIFSRFNIEAYIGHQLFRKNINKHLRPLMSSWNHNC